MQLFAYLQRRRPKTIMIQIKGDRVNRIKNLTLSFLLAVAFAGCSAEPNSNSGAASQPPQISEVAELNATAEIERLGGKVVADKQHPGEVWVWLQGSKSADAGLLCIKKLRRVRMVVLDATSVTDDGLVNLEGIDTLRNLCFNKTHVTDAGLVHLKGLTNLETLQLASTDVTDAGLAHLEGLTMLRELGLERTGVTDAGLVHVKGLTKLESLDLGRTKVTYDGGVKDLQKVLWNCTILFGSPPHVERPQSDFIKDEQGVWRVKKK